MENLLIWEIYKYPSVYAGSRRGILYLGIYTCTGAGFKLAPAIEEVFIELLSR
jgi:hypothetical protein